MAPSFKQYSPLDFGIGIPKDAFAPTGVDLWETIKEQNTKQQYNEALTKARELQNIPAEKAIKIAKEAAQLFTPDETGKVPTVKEKADELLQVLLTNGDLDNAINFQKAFDTRPDLKETFDAAAKLEGLGHTKEAQMLLQSVGYGKDEPTKIQKVGNQIVQYNPLSGKTKIIHTAPSSAKQEKTSLLYRPATGEYTTVPVKEEAAYFQEGWFRATGKPEKRLDVMRDGKIINIPESQRREGDLSVTAAKAQADINYTTALANKLGGGEAAETDPRRLPNYRGPAVLIE